MCVYTHTNTLLKKKNNKNHIYIKKSIGAKSLLYMDAKIKKCVTS